MVDSIPLAAADLVTGVTGSGRAMPPRRAHGHIRRLRVTAWTLRRLLRDPHRVPGAWRSPGFGARLDRVRAQLLPIRSLAALATSYGREHDPEDPIVRLAYGMRWLELCGALDERPWSLLCTPSPG